MIAFFRLYFFIFLFIISQDLDPGFEFTQKSPVSDSDSVIPGSETVVVCRILLETVVVNTGN